MRTIKLMELSWHHVRLGTGETSGAIYYKLHFSCDYTFCSISLTRIDFDAGSENVPTSHIRGQHDDL